MRNRRFLLLGLIGALLGCNGQSAAGEPQAEADDGKKQKQALASEAALARITTDKADILFVIDNSGSMREEQQALRAQFPRMLRALSSGDVNGDGVEDFPAFSSLRLGVVSTDMGLSGITGIPNCVGLGDDGVLQRGPRYTFSFEAESEPELEGCADTLPEFLTYESGEDELAVVASEFACLASLGTEGCGFEQPLEAALKATWPASDDSVRFIAPSDDGRLGHGDAANAHFLATDEDDPSLLIVVLVTDEEDCSSSNLEHFTPPNFLDPTNPLATQDLNLRCFFNPQNLYPTDRYVEGLRALRPNHPERVMFSVIAGVPPDLVDADARDGVDFDDATARDAYYDAMLDDARMIETIDETRTPEQGGNLTPSCIVDTDDDGVTDSRAYPPRRLVSVARDFGPNGFVQSICQGDFAPAMDALMNRMAERMAD